MSLSRTPQQPLSYINVMVVIEFLLSYLSLSLLRCHLRSESGPHSFASELICVTDV